MRQPISRSSEFQMRMSEKWSNAIAAYMALDWGLRLESLNPPYSTFTSTKTNGKVTFEVYFTNMFQANQEYKVSTEYINTNNLGLSDYVVICIWNKTQDNCVVLKTEDAVELMQNNSNAFALVDLVPKIKRKFEIGVNKMDNADIPNEAVGSL
jgi:hypothetical protein